MTLQGIKQNVEFMIQDTVEFTTAMRDNFQSMMEVYTKMNAVMDVAKQDALQGVIGYDETGSKIYDLDLLDEEK